MKTLLVNSRRLTSRAALPVGCALSFLALNLLAAAVAADPAALAKEAASYHSGDAKGALARMDQIIRQTPPGAPILLSLEQAILQVLRTTASEEAKRQLGRRLWLIGSPASLPVLEGMLANPETAHVACYALQNLPSPAVNAALRRALEKATGPARLAIMNTLADRRDADSVEPLRQLATGHDPETARTAVAGLGRIGNDPAGRILEQLWKSAEGKLKDEATLAWLQCAQRLARENGVATAAAIYQKIYDQPAGARWQRAALIGLVSVGGRNAVPLLLAACKSHDSQLRATAIAQIPSLPGQDVTLRFAEELAQLEPESQVLLLGALANRADPVASPAVTLLVESPNPQIAAAAVRTLGRVGEKSAVAVLAKALGRRDRKEIVAAASSSLRELPGSAVSDRILEILPRSSPEIRPDLMEVLVSRQATQAVHLILQQTVTPDANLASAAFRALSRLAGPEQLAALVNALVTLPNRQAGEEAEQAILQLAQKLKDPTTAATPILAVYPKTQGPARLSLLRVLGGLGGRPGLEPVLTATQDPETALSDAAIRILANWPDTSALQPVLELARSTAHPTYQVLALRGYLRLLSLPSDRTPSQTLAAFAEGLRLAKRPDEKRLVAAGLAEIPVPGALPLLTPLLDDDAVKAEAAQAVVKIATAAPGLEATETKATLQKAIAATQDAKLKQQAQALLQKIK